MVYKEAKKIFIDKISKEGIEIEKGAKSQVEVVKSLLKSYADLTGRYIDTLSYTGHQKDKQRYLAHLLSSLRNILEDKKATKQEMNIFFAALVARSENLRIRMILQQRAYEEMRFKDIKEKNDDSIASADFDSAIGRLERLKRALSPLNRTSPDGNLGENKLRLDLRIQEEINALKNLKKLYGAKYVAGNAFVSASKKFYIHSVDSKGNITFSPYKHDEKKKGSKPVFGKKRKLNWLKFKKLTEEQRCQVKKFDKRKYSDIDIEADKEVTESKARIEELKRLKEINYLYSGKALESIKNPEQRELMKKGIEEHYNSMRLYFEKDKNGVVRPTEVYKSLTVENRVKILIKMLTGINGVIQRLKLETALEKEKDSIKKMFMKAEIAYQKKDYMQAYAQFRAFIKKTKPWGYKGYQKQFAKLAKEWDLSGAINLAEARLREMSFRFINLGEKYVTAAVRQKADAFFLSNKVANKTYEEAMGVFNRMRKVLLSGEAYDLSTAWQKVGMPWLRANKDRMKGLKSSNLGLTETYLRVYHMPIIIKIAEIAAQTDQAKQQKMILTIADDARKTKFRDAASVLYKQYMKGDLRRFENDKKKTKEYWAAKRKRYLELKKSKFCKKLRKRATQMAKESAGARFKKMSKQEQQVMIDRYLHSLLEQETNKDTTKSLFKPFLRKAEGDNKAAARYIDMEDPFDEWFNLSDQGIDTLKKYAGEAIILGCSGGIGNLAGRGVTAGLRILAKKSAEKLIVRLATAGAGIAVDMVVSEVIDRGLRTILLGQKGLFSKKELMNFLKHSIATYGVLSLGGRISRLAMKRVQNAGQLAQQAVRVGSVFGVEAPLMATLNQGFAGWKGSWIDHYGNSIMTILASRAGMKLVHASTDNMLLRAERRLMFKADLSRVKATDPAKAQILEGMLKRGESIDSVEAVMNSDLSPDQMRKLSKYVDDPKNAGLLLAIKYAEETGTMTKKMKEQYQEYLLDLRLMGFSKRQAAKFARSITLQRLLTKHGEGARKVAEAQLDRAIYEQRRETAKAYLRQNVDKIRKLFKNSRIKSAFEYLMNNLHGQFALFETRNPKLARLIPPSLRKIAILSIPLISVILRLPLRVKPVKGLSANIAFNVESSAKQLLGQFKVGHEFIIRDSDNCFRRVEITRIDKENGFINFYDHRSHSEGGFKVTAFVQELGKVNRDRSEALKLAKELQRIGMDTEAEYIADLEQQRTTTGRKIRTMDQRRTLVMYLQSLHEILGEYALDLAKCGLKNEADNLLNYKDISKFPNIESRIHEAQRLLRGKKPTSNPKIKQAQDNTELFNTPYGHGTNSSTLIGVARDKGLLPTGKLIKNGTPPFTGELRMGISTGQRSKGVNASRVSLANIGFGHNLDITYATGEGTSTLKPLEGWTPAIGQANLTELKKKARDLERKLKNKDDDFIDITGQQLSTVKKLIAIEKQRLALYPKLSKLEKSFVETPFPIIFRIKEKIDPRVKASNKGPEAYEKYRARIQKDVKYRLKLRIHTGQESSYQGLVKVNEHMSCVLVPADKVRIVRQYLKSKGINLPVLPIELVKRSR